MAGIIDDVTAAFPEKKIAKISGYYDTVISECANIYKGKPPWEMTKRGGLYSSKKTNRRRELLNTGTVLCNEFSAMTFSEKLEISISDEGVQEYVNEVLDDNGFYKNFGHFLSEAYALGGGVIKLYAENGKPVMDFVSAENFVPLEYNNRMITGGCFRSVTVKGKDYYTLLELHELTEAGVEVRYRLYRSAQEFVLGVPVPLSELYEGLPERVFYEGVRTPLFAYFAPAGNNNIDSNIPLGLSIFKNSISTLKSLDIAFDSFSREFILGKKRIIVPSSCIRTVVNPDSGKPEKYFDTDDEVYQALQCDEEKDLKVTDNTCEIRVTEHVAAINALLDILCFQTGLSAGTLSFDRSGGLKTATEVISENSKTARTMQAHKNMVSECLDHIIHSLADLGVWLKDISQAEFSAVINFNDNIIEDRATIIDNNIKLVSAGLKSKLAAIMEVNGCDEQTAKKELERINSENNSGVMGNDENFDPAGDEADNDDIVEEAEKEAGKTLNGAQTQSLISVMGQYKAGVLSLGQAVNIVSVSIGISKEEARKIIEGSE